MEQCFPESLLLESICVFSHYVPFYGFLLRFLPVCVLPVKALLQARHRQEEAEARNRKKERDARTHRLVQEGAILESIVPHIKEMDLDSLKRELIIRLRGM